MAGGWSTVSHAEPSFPADATTSMPAALTLSTTVWRIVGSVQPSLGGHVQELLITSGAFEGSGFWPERSVGAMNHWKHSV